MSSEGNFQAEMTGRVAEILAALNQIEGKTFTEIGSAGFEHLYIRMLACQVRFECAAQEFIYSGEHYATRGKLAGEDAEVMHAHYLYQRKRESFISSEIDCQNPTLPKNGGAAGAGTSRAENAIKSHKTEP